MREGIKSWAPLPLRLALGIGLMFHGGIKLFVAGGHENIAYLITKLGVQFPELMAWVVGLVEFVGGLGILLGVFLPVCAGLNALNVGGLMVFGALAGGIPDPLPGGDPLPQYSEAVLILAGTLTLLLGGAGKYSGEEFVRRWSRMSRDI
jgi:putative oxidoreductase